MQKSEIDDIFASKGKAKAIQPVASSFTVPEKKRKRDKKKRRDVEAAKIDNTVTTNKRPAPETIVDPSTCIPSAKRAKVAVTTTTKHPLKLGKKDGRKDDEDRFKDSRGSGPRRKTEEGFSIFKEDELGIGTGGGGETDPLVCIVILHFKFFSDTPLCPFDCQCCF